MTDSILEQLRKRLDSETQTESLLALPRDFYSDIAAYSQKLKRSAGSGSSEVSIHLVSAQAKLLESMVKQMLNLRLRKALRLNMTLQLLPEERYICAAEQRFQKRFQTMVRAVSGGQPSFVEFAHASESQRSVTVKFVKHVNELVGLDLRHYGPFEPEDVASIPAASADILIAGGDAVEVLTRDAF